MVHLGVTLHATSGALTGTPTSPFGPAAFTVVAQNKAGTSKPVSINVTALPPGAPTINAGVVIDGIGQRRAATTAFADAHVAVLHSLIGTEALLEDAEALTNRAAEESLMSPVRTHVAEIVRCNTSIMAQLAQDAPSHRTIDEQVQRREGAVAELYNAVSTSRALLGTITDECNNRAAEIAFALGGMQPQVMGLPSATSVPAAAANVAQPTTAAIPTLAPNTTATNPAATTAIVTGNVAAGTVSSTNGTPTADTQPRVGGESVQYHDQLRKQKEQLMAMIRERVRLYSY